MLLNNTLAAYSEQQIELLGKKIESLVETLKETDLTLGREIKEPSTPEEGDNVYHVDPRPFVEFQRLEKVSMPFHEIVDVYDKWNDTLWELVHANVGQYTNKKLVLSIIRVRQIVGTFENFFDDGPRNESPKVG